MLPPDLFIIIILIPKPLNRIFKRFNFKIGLKENKILNKLKGKPRNPKYSRPRTDEEKGCQDKESVPEF